MYISYLLRVKLGSVGDTCIVYCIIILINLALVKHLHCSQFYISLSALFLFECNVFFCITV